MSTHKPWCDQDPYLCADIGCRGPLMTSTAGVTRLVPGAGTTPDVEVILAGHTVLTPGQALEMAYQLAEQARVGLGGDPVFDFDQRAVQDLRDRRETEVLDQLAPLLLLAAYDATKQKRPEHLARFKDATCQRRKAARDTGRPPVVAPAYPVDYSTPEADWWGQRPAGRPRPYYADSVGAR